MVIFILKHGILQTKKKPTRILPKECMLTTECWLQNLAEAFQLKSMKESKPEE